MTDNPVDQVRQDVKETLALASKENQVLMVHQENLVSKEIPDIMDKKENQV